MIMEASYGSRLEIVETGNGNITVMVGFLFEQSIITLMNKLLNVIL